MNGELVYTADAAGTGYTFTGKTGSSVTSYSTPAVTVRAVELEAGWVGQIVVGDLIVWQAPTNPAAGGDYDRTRQDALNGAQNRVQERLAQLFGGGV